MVRDGSGAPLRIGNASGFYGDRFTAVREMLADGPLDVLTGDYLAELTMALLAVNRLKDPAHGYARTFLRQMEECLGLAVERGVGIVTNAGGLNPAALAEKLRELAARLGVDATTCWAVPTNSACRKVCWPRTPTSAPSVSPRRCARARTWSSPAG